jgi:LPPG:FO 2-phospho-L-lactate transferase
MEPNAVSVALLYAEFLDVLVIDNVDADLKPQIEALGVAVVVTDTIMASMEKKSTLARTVIEAAGV